MILAEPSPSQGDLHFSLLGFPVRIHPMFWLMALLLSNLRAEPIFVVLWVVAVVLCILLHEMGHAVVMQAYGYRVSIVLYSFGGLAIPHPGRSGIRRPGPWGDMLIAFAGPASGFILAAVLALGLHYLGGYQVEMVLRVVPQVLIRDHRVLEAFFLNSVLEITVLWGVLNLLPIYPLDGGQIAQQIFVLTHPQDAIRQSLVLSVIVGAMMVAIALMKWNDWFLAVFFVYLTYTNFITLQSYRSGGGWY
ncbi:MAG: site-2 protease family protein [Thermoguttaceae bacterium]